MLVTDRLSELKGCFFFLTVNRAQCIFIDCEIEKYFYFDKDNYSSVCIKQKYLST